MSKRSDAYGKWDRVGRDAGWEMPRAHWLKRLPVIRHARAIAAAFRVDHHYRQMPFGIRSGYDEWVLWGIAHGLEGPPE